MAKQKVGTINKGLSRGSTGYAINFFRKDILVNLQTDLKRLERTGIDEEICAKIKVLLSAMVNAASAEPKASMWGPAVYEVLRDYEKSYAKWNDVNGQDPQAIAKRAEILEKLQDIRQKLANACRSNSHSLSEAHDLALVSAINDALVDTIKVVPGTFSALAKSAARFEVRAMRGEGKG